MLKKGRRSFTFEDEGEAVLLVHVGPLHDAVVDGKGLVVVVELHRAFTALVGQGRQGQQP